MGRSRSWLSKLETRNRLPAAMALFQVMPNSQPLYACAPEDDIRQARKTTRAQETLGLPVVSGGTLRGVLCLNNIALKKKQDALFYAPLWKRARRSVNTGRPGSS